ncbi:MAG TPA: OmpA family protein [Bacteroidales bacterium]|nr:OmpA family protein [Bacteroidales bacterium]HPE23537.1 OmpA family protein [Bacteroidales bacterium]HPJ06207.1 OmpA family protein [Bacteroidales bacterium]HPQ64886.1 OmpA family protein [Bacteroidales bacterium]HRW27976.1 OmpA family protein [Bacteroidales bacterium]
MNRTVVLIIIVALVFPSLLQAQKQKTERAYAAYEAGSYYDAIDHFKDVYSKTRDRQLKAEMVFMVSECYRLINDPKNAELWYKRAVRSPFPKPEAQYWLADSYKKLGRYPEAIEEFRAYRQLVPGDPRTEQQIRACELAMEWQASPEAYNVEELKDVNSRDSDFSPAYARDDHGLLWFTSSRDDARGNREHGATGQSFTDIFETRLDKKGKWSTPVPVDFLNTEFEDGTPSFSSDYTEVFFTRCEAGKRESKGCVIMYSSREGVNWSDPQKIELLDDTLVAAHPALSPDGQTLYFVSDMPGGRGGKDLYRTTRTSPGSPWSRPENLGTDVNTRGNELFPFVHEDGTLYFASDGHIGMGGLDIFRAVPQGGDAWLVQNMMAPVNSPADDFGITFERGSEKGIFSSSRKGRTADDLYTFEMPPLLFSITGLVRDEKTGQPVEGATVQLIASDGANMQTETGAAGDFRFTLRPEVDYIFLASRKGYLNGKEKETTRGQDKSRDFMATIQLTPIDRPIELPNIFYDFGKWDLRPESMVSLDRLVETLNDNPNVTIELMSHTDSRDTEEFNLDLSQKRAQSVVDYLIAKGIAADRLTARGYGETNPKVVDQEIIKNAPFLRSGATLNEQYINSLASEEQKEIAHQINRRTEFRVLRTDYEPAQ